MTVQELIDKLNAVEDKSMLVGLECERCETWDNLGVYSSVHRPVMHSAQSDTLDDCPTYSEEVGDCMCDVPVMFMIRK